MTTKLTDAEQRRERRRAVVRWKGIIHLSQTEATTAVLTPWYHKTLLTSDKTPQKHQNDSSVTWKQTAVFPIYKAVMLIVRQSFYFRGMTTDFLTLQGTFGVMYWNGQKWVAAGQSQVNGAAWSSEGVWIMWFPPWGGRTKPVAASTDTAANFIISRKRLVTHTQGKAIIIMLHHQDE